MVGQTKRVLVVEDDAANVKVLRFSLKASGFTVLHTANGREALDHLDHEQPDAVILDLPSLMALAKTCTSSGVRPL